MSEQSKKWLPADHASATTTKTHYGIHGNGNEDDDDESVRAARWRSYGESEAASMRSGERAFFSPDDDNEEGGKRKAEEEEQKQAEAKAERKEPPSDYRRRGLSAYPPINKKCAKEGPAASAKPEKAQAGTKKTQAPPSAEEGEDLPFIFDRRRGGASAYPSVDRKNARETTGAGSGAGGSDKTTAAAGTANERKGTGGTPTDRRRGAGLYPTVDPAQKKYSMSAGGDGCGKGKSEGDGELGGERRRAAGLYPKVDPSQKKYSMGRDEVTTGESSSRTRRESEGGKSKEPPKRANRPYNPNRPNRSPGL